MKKAYLAVLMVGFLTAAAAVPVYAGHGGGCPGGQCSKGGRGDWGGDKKLDKVFFYKAHKFLALKDKIGLSEEQVKAITDLKLEMKKSYIREKAELKILEMEIASKLHDTKVDVEAIKPLIEKKYEAKKAMTLTFLEAYAKLKGTLTDKQRDTLKAMKAQQGNMAFGGGGA